MFCAYEVPMFILPSAAISSSLDVGGEGVAEGGGAEGGGGGVVVYRAIFHLLYSSAY